jgi:prepilin-type N-terminal cleavage/methylation domain-containing protein
MNTTFFFIRVELHSTPAPLPSHHMRRAGEWRVYSRNAVTLLEIMVVLTVIGILISFSVPTYQRAIEQSRADIAAANLRAVWSAQRLYWLENHCYTGDLGLLRGMGLLDPTITLSASGYSYSATAAKDTFSAIAARTGSSRWNGKFEIDQTGAISGAIRAQGEPDIAPGFH